VRLHAHTPLTHKPCAMSENPTETLQLLTLKETASRLAISKRSLEREIAQGNFPRPLKIGRSVRVRLDVLRNYVASLSGGVPA
jgi:excisionase family DNA binding protein